MTDNEIIKALECCTNNYECPTECPLYKTDGDCLIALNKPTLDLINRQKEEIEILKKYNTDVAFKHYNNGITDGVEMFANRLQECYKEYDDFAHIYARDIRDTIDFVEEEMVGDNDESKI